MLRHTPLTWKAFWLLPTTYTRRRAPVVPWTMDRLNSRPFSHHITSPLLKQVNEQSSSIIPVEINLSDDQKAHCSGIWLRDHCQCASCRHPITKQRMLNTSQIPLHIAPSKTTWDELDGHRVLKLTWPDGHESIYTLDWLDQYLRPEKYNTQVKDLADQKDNRIFWDATCMERLRPTVPYDEVMGSELGVYQWLRNVSIYGLGIVNGVPATAEATEKLLERISFIRRTHYGKFWVVHADLAHGDTAYTRVGLPLHTDTTYFTDPVGLQLFHILRHEGTGGESTFLDGFRAADLLRNRSPEAWETLTTIPIPSAAQGDTEVDVRPSLLAHPILNLHPRTKELHQIRYNNDDRIPMPHTSLSDTLQFYWALREWRKVLDEEGAVWKLCSPPGTAIIFDNWRVLHGREAFTGDRTLSGGYIGGDDWKSRFRVLERQFGKGRS